ncbi:hypothetical protein G6L16_008720 [Agrobacterium tumefaciens]|uniref:hypothetical protein n=1 Tax=Agrobacterium tumefaciens TaxID=358 RepID=UPI0015732935|nr:hypothetical protein [Agrobacterium tumefaciens]NSZ63420.1 hypothetical protein [Agrobacterium tumefaciens]NTA69790.1 hypothetical protein [Agrobacterium tumefaciens]WIE36936.1 hypothetical protein G6L16_008720 [Agrobacterium tumefaciens]
MNVAQRTHDACEQLTRYGGGILDNAEPLVAALEGLAEINDDLWHSRDPALTMKTIGRVKKDLDRLSVEIMPTPAGTIRLSSFQSDVLQHLFEDEKRELYSSLNSIAVNLQCEKNRVRLACRALKRKGLAKQVPFHDDEGFIRGSGYGITPAGIAYGDARAWKGGDE